MSITEFLGFVISLAAIFFVFFRQAWDARQKRKNPEAYEQQRRQKERRLKELLGTLDMDIDEEEENPRTKPLTKNKSPKKTAIIPPVPLARPISQSQKLVSQQFHHKEAYKTKQLGGKPSRAQILLRSLRSRKEMIILNEIIGPPKSSQDKK